MTKGEVIALPRGERRGLGWSESYEVSCAVEERGEETGLVGDRQKRRRGQRGS